MVAREQVLITLSGGTPWGFRLQGGSEQGRPLQVAKVRKRSKACRGGLLENDMLVSINGKTCTGLSHAGAMHLIDSSSNVLHILVTRSSTGQDTDATKFMGGVKQIQSPPPSNDITPVISRAELRVLSPPPSVTMRSKKQPQAVISQSTMNDKIHVIRQSPEPLPPCRLDSLTSPPDSEAYYAETDSDADTMALVNMTQDKPQQRRPKRRSPRSSPRLIHRESLEEVSELSSYDSAAEPEEPSAYTVGQQHGRSIFSPTSHSNGESGMVSKKEISYEEVLPSESPIPESPVSGTKSPLLQMAAEGKLIPMVGPVDFPVDETLTTTYKDKAKQAKLHRSESVQEKQVKEARTKCRTIASLLTDAPNPHSKGVLMFKKRRQRAKKYTLVSFGSVDKNRYNEEEDGSFPTTSESEFDEEGFYEARSLTDQSFSDWDSTYLGVEKQQTELESQQGLSEAAGKGAILFQQQRQKTVQSTAQHVPKADSMPEVKEQFHGETTPEKCKVSGDSYPRKTPPSSAINVPTESVRSLPVTRSESVPTQCFSSETQIESVAPQAGTFNRTARPFAAGFLEKRATTTPVVFRPSFPKARTEMQVSQNQAAAPFSPDFYESSKSALSSEQQQSGQHSSPAAAAAASLYVSPSQRQTVASSSQSRKGEKTSELKSTSETPGSAAVTSSTSLYISLPSKSGIQSPSPQITSGKPADHRLAMSSAHPHSHFVTSPPNEKSMSGSSPMLSQPTTNSLVSPAIAITSLSHARSPSEPLISREQRIAVPASRTGILQDARRRGGKKQMFTPLEPKPKESPNPELLSMVQNLDEKPKQDHVGAGFESGPEEDFLSLGAEACNFMQFQARKSKTPPPVAPKPQLRSAFVNVVNGSPRTDSPQIGGKGAELFAKRQSRMDKFVVEGSSFQTSIPRSPSPTPSLPASWKYSSNIRAPPPIAYNPLHSPYHPQVAVRSTPTKVDSKYKKSTKTGIQAIDFMRHQPYQLNPAMFCFDGSSTPPTQTSQKQGNMPTSSKQTGQFFSPAKQVPLKTASVHEVKRFSTPMPLSGSSSLTPAVITPRSATTLAEPVWRSEITSPPTVLTRSISAPKVQVQDIRQCKSAPDLSRVDAHDCSGLHCAPDVATVHVPKQTMTSTLMFKPRFSVSRLGTQANVWRPATVHQ